MYAKKNADKRVDIRSMNNLVPLNFDRTIFLYEVRSGDGKKKLIVKTILMIGDNQQFQASQEAILRKTFSSSLYYFKPEFYDFKDNYLHIGMKIQPLSLQSLIWIHKKEQKVFSTAFVRDFTVRIFQGIARLKSSQIFPQNLKPSNIFLEIRSLQDKNWVWSEAGLHTTKRCQAYYKLNLQNIVKNNSIKIDPYQMQFYSLAIMLLEMITFQSPQAIDKSIRSTSSINNINNFADAEDYYGARLIQIIRLLIQPPKDNSLNKAIQEYKQSQQQEENQGPDYQAYQFTQERLQSVFKNNFIQKVIEDCRSHIKSQNLTGRDIFDKLTLLDPQFNFAFNGITELQELIDFLGAKAKDHELLYLATFLTSMSSIRYFRLLQSIFPHKQLIECIIAKASENYESFKEFFQSQTGNKDFWKVEQIKLFLDSLQTPFQQKDIVDTVKQWTKGNSKTSIKYSEIYAIFKPIIGMSMTLSSIKKPATLTAGGQDGFSDAPKILRIIMSKLKTKLQEQKGQDLISFFRKHDLKENWTVDSKIYKIIKNYTKQKSLDDQKYRKAFIQMQKEGSIQGDMTKQINYIFLIRNLQLQEPITLLRQAITQKINESSREDFFQKYRKEKGWTFQSLIQFNKDQQLEFEDRELRSLFSQMDSDRSGVIQAKELFYKLTNVKQFDYEYIIQQIKEKKTRQGLNLFKYFKQYDPKARLLLNSPQELKQILDFLGITISEDHLQQLYGKFSKKGRFDYFSFLREFYTNYQLFLLTVRFIVQQHYKGSFDKLYQMGLKQGKKKWNIDSISLLNEQLILGLRDAQIKDIWSELDPQKEGSLTKQEVAQIFRYDFQRTTELKTKNLESIKDLPKRKQQEKKKESNPSKKPVQEGHQQQKKQGRLYQQIKEIGDKNLLAICTKLLQISPQKNGLIAVQDCIQAFKDKNSRINFEQFKKIASTFKESESKKAKINFINLFFYLCDHIYDNQQELAIKLKTSLVIGIIKQIKRLKQISNRRIFQWCKRKNVMRLSDFQEVIRKLVQVEVYYSDLQPIWIHWGQPQYLTEEDFDNILQTKQYVEKLEREKSGRQKDLLLQKKGSNRPKNKLTDDNKMKDFVNQDSGSDTPQLRKPISFGEKQSNFRRQNSRKNSIRENDERKNSHQQTPISKFKQQSKNRQKQSRFNRERQRDIKQSNDDRKKSPFPSKKPKQQKIQLQQYVKPIKQISKREDKQRLVFNKNQLLEKFRNEVSDHGQQRVNQLFSKTNVIQSKRFISCLTINYNFSEEQAAQLADHLARFDKIKLDVIKEQLTKKHSQSKQLPNKSKERQQRNKNPQRSSISPKKNNDNEGQKKLLDPRRQKANVPLIKQQIKQIKNQFCKRFGIHEMQAFYFAQRDSLSRNDFITKCQSISTNFSTNICEKIFDFLRPDGQDRVTLLTFRIGFSMDQPMEEQQEDYLPQQLEKQLKIIFQKADKDHSGYIQSDEVEQLLSSLGFNENLKEIQNYFAKMDQNFDNKISYNQFRVFIEDQILPQISSFDQDEEQLQQILRNNDIFRSGSLPITTFQAVIERYGVKLSQLQTQILLRALNPEGLEINIRKVLQAVRQPTFYEGKVRGVLYKIRLRKKVQLRQIQKIFENISSCFVLAYIPTVMEKQIINISTPYRPVLHESGLFYCDLALRDARKTGMSQQGLIAGEIGNNDILVQLSLKQISGVPIPQKPQIKNNIVRRYLNISFFDLSAEILKYSIWQVDCEWDPEVEDIWRFGNSFRSVFVKVSGYEPRKLQKIVILIQLVVAVVENNRTLEINCGSTTVPLRDLVIPDGKTTKKLKLIAGLPNRSKELDKNSITKRTGWKNFFGGQTQSEMQIDIIHQNKFKEYHKMIASLPAQIIVGRKALPYMWIYRQVMAEASFDGNSLNTHLGLDLKILAFRLSLDVPQAYNKVWLWWKDKVQSRVKTLQQLKKIFKILMQDLHLIFNAKQFQLIKRCPSKAFIHNKTLIASRNKMVNEVLENVQNWISSDLSGPYKRRKAYNYNYGPLQLYEADLPKQHRAFIENIAKLIAK